MCILPINAQIQDSTLYKVKLENFKIEAHNWEIVTLAAAGVTVIGGVLFGVGISLYSKGLAADDVEEWDKAEDYYHKGEICYISGLAAGVVGVLILIPSAINWGIGKKKVREYQLKLDNLKTGFYYAPNYVGLKLAFKF
jgi:uncharacterized membrane protein